MTPPKKCVLFCWFVLSSGIDPGLAGALKFSFVVRCDGSVTIDFCVFSVFFSSDSHSCHKCLSFLLAHWANFISPRHPCYPSTFSCLWLCPHSVSLLSPLPCPPTLTVPSCGCHDGLLWSSAGLPLHSGSVGGLPVRVRPLLLFGRLSWPGVCFGSFHRAWDRLLSATWRLHQPHLSAAPPSWPQRSRTAAQGLFTALDSTRYMLCTSTLCTITCTPIHW